MAAISYGIRCKYTISGGIQNVVFKAWEQKMNESIVIYNENEKQTNKKLKQNNNSQPKP